MYSIVTPTKKKWVRARERLRAIRIFPMHRVKSPLISNYMLSFFFGRKLITPICQWIRLSKILTDETGLFRPLLTLWTLRSIEKGKRPPLVGRGVAGPLSRSPGCMCIVVVVRAGVWMFQNLSRQSTPLRSRVKVGVDDGDNDYWQREWDGNLTSILRTSKNGEWCLVWPDWYGEEIRSAISRYGVGRFRPSAVSAALLSHVYSFSKFFAALECDVFDGSPFTYEGVHSKRPSCVSVNSNSSDDDGNKYFVTLSY